MNILITGGNGYIAQGICNHLNKKHNITSVSRGNFHLTDYAATRGWFRGREYDVVVHTAACGGNRLRTNNYCTYEDNMKMFNNLVASRHSFKKLITFGSGAEMFHDSTPYANSKRDIAKQIENLDGFYNLRIFGVFDENELSTRFIKANILRYINKEPMIVHQNKIMDFIYMQDLISIVKYYITNVDLEKDINCCYQEKYTLKTIANMINSLGNHNVPIVVENKTKLEFYCGESSEIPMKMIGLKTGIDLTFQEILNKFNLHNSGDLNNA